LPINQVEYKSQADRLAVLHGRYFQLHGDTLAPGGLKQICRQLGLASRAPLDAYVPELEAMHNELASLAADWKPRLSAIMELLGDSDAAADVYDSIAHLDTCVVWLHHIASRYVSGAPYPSDEVLRERVAYEGARAGAQAHAERMKSAFAAISRSLD
jgi:hypothetical protein